VAKNLNFQKVEKPFETKGKQGIMDKDEKDTEYVCTGRSKFGIGTYAVRKKSSGFSKSE